MAVGLPDEDVLGVAEPLVVFDPECDADADGVPVVDGELVPEREFVAEADADVEWVLDNETDCESVSE